MSELAITGWRKEILDLLYKNIDIDRKYNRNMDYIRRLVSVSKVPAYQISKDAVVLFPIYEDRIQSRKQALRALYKYSFEKLDVSREIEVDVSLFLSDDIVKLILVIIGGFESVRSSFDEIYACIRYSNERINNVISMHSHPDGHFHVPSQEDIDCYDITKKLETNPILKKETIGDHALKYLIDNDPRHLFSYKSFILSEYGFFDLNEMYHSTRSNMKGVYYLNKKTNRICHRTIGTKITRYSVDDLISKSIGGYRWILEEHNFPKEKYNIVDMGI